MGEGMDLAPMLVVGLEGAWGLLFVFGAVMPVRQTLTSRQSSTCRSVKPWPQAQPVSA